MTRPHLSMNNLNVPGQSGACGAAFPGCACSPEGLHHNRPIADDHLGKSESCSVSLSPQSGEMVESLEPRVFLSVDPFTTRQFYQMTQAAPRVIATGDINGDGLPDLAFPIPSENVFGVMLNQGNGHFGRPKFYSFQTPRAIAIADFNGDGFGDLAVTGTDAQGDNVVAIYFGNGNGTFSNTPVRYGIASSGIAIATADLANNGLQDIIVTTGRRIAVLMNNGNGTFATPVYYNVGGNNITQDIPSSIAIGDFNNDGLADIAVPLEQTGTIGILLNNPADPGTFGPPTVYIVPGNPLSITTGDFNNDGKTDLAVISSGFNVRSVNILLGNGDGTFGPAITYPGANFADAVGAADFTGDGNEDLIVGSFDGPLQYWAGNGDGTFAAPINIPGALYVEDVQVADLNGDGLPDIVVPSAGIKVYLNRNVSGSTTTGGPTTQTIGEGAAAKSFTFFAIDGTQTTITMQGPGQATLDFSSSQTIELPTTPNQTPVIAQQLSAITTTGTTSATILSVSTRLRSQLAFTGTISTDAAIGAINAPTTNLTGNLTLVDGARSVSLFSASGGTISIPAGQIGTLAIGQVAGETITAGNGISRLSISGDASMTLNTPSVGTFTVGRSLHDSTIDLTAAGVTDIASLSVGLGINNVVLNSAGNIGTIAAFYMSDDDIFGGIGTLSPGQTFPTASNFVAAVTIGAIRLQTPALRASFESSVIAASRINTLSLGSILTDNNGTPFGVVANSIGTFSGTDRIHAKTFTLSNLNSAADVSAQIAAKKLNLLDLQIEIV